jgi:hypothetical protein
MRIEFATGASRMLLSWYWGEGAFSPSQGRGSRHTRPSPQPLGKSRDKLPGAHEFWDRLHRNWVVAEALRQQIGNEGDWAEALVEAAASGNPRAFWDHLSAGGFSPTQIETLWQDTRRQLGRARRS